jgi:TatD DNase family protein
MNATFIATKEYMIKSQKAKHYFKIIPINKILFETDAPYTIGFKNKYNLYFCDEIYNFLSLIYDYTIIELKSIILNNMSTLLK